MSVVKIARLANKAYKRWGIVGKRIAQCFKNINRTIYSCDIAYQVDIPKNIQLPHQGLGVVIHPQTILGEDCTIYQNVTSGATISNDRKDERQAPIIGNNVMIGAGTVILGGITIGSNVQIGANSVVLNNVPDNVVIVGAPAVIKRYII